VTNNLYCKFPKSQIGNVSQHPPTNSTNSLIRNILLASPYFPRFYADVLISEGHNPNEARILAERYLKNVGVNMPLQSSPKVCTHIKVTGVRCGSPALRGEQFCYFHQRMVRGVKTPPQSRLHPIALIENEESIQASLMEVINALARNTIDLKRAELIIRALHIAAKNARRARFDLHPSDMVKEVPDYSAPPANASTTTVHVGTGAFARPSSPELTARSAPSTQPTAVNTEETKPLPPMFQQAWDNLVA
jgi:hypothetical protein